MKSIIVILFILTCACPDFSGLQAQVNLIRNGGFEEETTDTCGANSFTSEYCPIKYWYQHNGISPEYFKSCSSTSQYGVPNNFGGFQYDASTGNSYIGLFTYSDGAINEREYIMTELLDPLIVGKIYKFTMYISRSDYYVVASNIGICFEQDSIYRNDLITEYTPTSTALVYQTDTTIKDCDNWVKFEYIFTTSTSGLKHLIIGNFRSHLPIFDFLPLTSYCGILATFPYTHAYYIIDDVSLYCLDCDTNITCAIAIPDAYTPNRDGLNDEWKPLINIDCIEEIDNYLLRIFNRWGEVVFTTHDKYETWKGINNEIGTYVYYLQYDDRDKIQTKQGNVELIR